MLNIRNELLDFLIERLANLAGLEADAEFRQVYVDLALRLVQLRRAAIPKEAA